MFIYKNNIALSHPIQEEEQSQNTLNINNPSTCDTDNAPHKRKIDETDTEASDVHPLTKKPATSASINTSQLLTLNISQQELLTHSLNSTLSNDTIIENTKPASKHVTSAAPNLLTLKTHSASYPQLFQSNENSSPITSGLKVVQGYRTIFISKLHPSTNALDIKNYIATSLKLPR